MSGEIIGDFEKNVFGYRIQKEGLSYNLPYKAMVGRPVKTPEEGFKHFVTQKLKGTKVKASGDEVVDIIAEVKYDGERTQIHYENGEVNLFSRNFDSQNKKFWLLKERLELFFEKCRSQQFSLFKW